MGEPRVLVVALSKHAFGGVVEFNKMLRNYSKSELVYFNLFSGGRRSGLVNIVLLILDYLGFLFINLSFNYDIIHLNPSLNKKSLIREGFFILICRFLNKNVYIHWHGWNPANEYLLNEKLNYFIRETIFKAKHIKFLSKDFQYKFRSSGFRGTSSIGTTFIDDKLLNVGDAFYMPKEHKDNKKFKILFLSTISKNKGIYVALEVYNSLKVYHSNIEFIVAGIGGELENVKKEVERRNLKDITFCGFVSGKEKAKIFLESDLYFFPSFYEGLPTSVLEAMSFGLPIVCSNVGALPEIFVNGQMGFMSNSLNREDYIENINKLILNTGLRNAIGAYNWKYARENFIASKCVEKIDQDYRNIIINNYEK